MSTPPLGDSLRELQALVRRLNQATEELNQTIESFEETLKTISPGIQVWCSSLLFVDHGSGPPSSGWGSQLGFMRWRDQWRLVVRRGLFVIDGTQATPVEEGNHEVVPLLEASREERAAAVPLFPTLVAELKTEAQHRLLTIEKLNKKGR